MATDVDAIRIFLLMATHVPDGNSCMVCEAKDSHNSLFTCEGPLTT